MSMRLIDGEGYGGAEEEIERGGELDEDMEEKRKVQRRWHLHWMCVLLVDDNQWIGGQILSRIPQ